VDPELGKTEVKASAADSIRCPVCGSVQSPENAFCPQCGVPMPASAGPSGLPESPGQREIDLLLDSVDRERPYPALRVAGTLLGALGWVGLAASVIVTLAAIVTVLLAKPLPTTWTRLILGLLTAIALALGLLAGSDLVDWAIDNEQHAREANVLLERLVRGSLMPAGPSSPD